MSTSALAATAQAIAPEPTAASAPATPCRIWVDDPASFSTERMQAIRHDYHRHPLMQMSALARLAEDLYATRQCRFITPGAKKDSAFHHEGQSPDGRTIREVFDRIEEPGSWVALYNVETHPLYRDFLREVTEGVRALVEPQEPGMYNVGGFIFISAPPSVTPFHIDRENNFWLQIHGRKQMTVWDPSDRQVLAQDDIEKFIVYAGLENVKLREGTLARGTTFDCAPGDGVYFPSTSPHMTTTESSWATPGNGVAVSIGVVFYTDHTRRLANMHAGNMFLRQLGLKPGEIGLSGWRDGLRYLAGRSFISVKKHLRGYKPKNGL